MSRLSKRGRVALNGPWEGWSFSVNKCNCVPTFFFFFFFGMCFPHFFWKPLEASLGKFTFLSKFAQCVPFFFFFFFFFFFCGRCFLHLFRNQWQASWENFSLLSQSVHLFLRHTHTNSTQLMKRCCLLLSFLLSSSCTCAGCTIPLW